MRFLLALLFSAGLAAAAIPDSIVRPDTVNFVHPATVAGASSAENAASTGYANGAGVVFSNSDLSPTPGSSSQLQLSEYSFGQPFTAYQTPYDGYADDVLREGTTLPGSGVIEPVFSKLYPAGFGTSSGVTATRSQIQNADGTNGPRVAFRFRFLLFGQDQTPGAPPQIINLFEQLQGEGAEGWFTDEDRALAEDQIEILREALAYAPLDRSLQSALLDIYYDIATAEMQAANLSKVQIARKRLGLETVSEFIIDEEIAAYTELVRITEEVLMRYGQLFDFTMEGVNPSDFAPISSGGAPFGYFVFQNQVPLRNQTPTTFAPMDDSAVTNVIAPGETNTFSGYKDYRNLLNILGEYCLAQAELARLRGMRQADGDINEARAALTKTQEAAALACFLENMFRDVDFENDVEFENTGVRGARVLVRNGLNEALGARAFLNGTSNILGLDRNFLLLVPNRDGFDESYDVLVSDLIESATGLADGPLGKAFARLVTARTEYENFRASVDQVQSQLNGLEDDYAERFAEITGFDAEPGPGDPVWDGLSGAPGSELAAADANIEAIRERNRQLGVITLQLAKEAALAEGAVTLANGIKATVTGAETTYLSETSSAWTEIHVWAGAAAGSQAATDAVYAAAGVDGVSTFFSGGGNAIAIGVAGAVNTGVQTAAATRTSMREQELEEAAISRETTLALAEQPLTVQQARIEAAALYRESLANVLEIQDNQAALAQAVADKTTLLLEVQRMMENLDGDLAALSQAYFADPIHFVRAERSLLQANASFRNAQRYTFFTCRALEYKWQEKFAISEDSTAFDISSIFKARNASELQAVVDQMKEFDRLRRLSSGTGKLSNTTFVSLRDHLVTPNPSNQDLSVNAPDNGLRYDATTRETIDSITAFRRELADFQVSPPVFGLSGEIVIPFDSTRLEGLSNFFTGASYSLGSDDVTEGRYLNKITAISVHIVTEDGPTNPNNIDINGTIGSLVYAGNTFFRTRVPVCPDRSTPDAFNSLTDFSGEFVVAPFRFFQDTNFTGVFETLNTQDVDMKFASSQLSSRTDGNLRTFLANSSNGFRDTTLSERSVAATRWELRINPGQIAIENIKDIEIVFEHTSVRRPQITCN